MNKDEADRLISTIRSFVDGSAVPKGYNAPKAAAEAPAVVHAPGNGHARAFNAAEIEALYQQLQQGTQLSAYLLNKALDQLYTKHLVVITGASSGTRIALPGTQAKEAP